MPAHRTSTWHDAAPRRGARGIAAGRGACVRDLRAARSLGERPFGGRPLVASDQYGAPRDFEGRGPQHMTGAGAGGATRVT